MACREVEINGTIVKKIVPLSNLKLPSLNDYIEDENILDEILNKYKLNSRERTMVEQQYNEYYIYNLSNEEQKEVIAPILEVKENIGNVPILYFPYFTPLASNEEVWKLSEEQSLVLLGVRSSKIGVSEKELCDFINIVKTLNINFGLIIEDILYNPSNIGYNEKYGLRVIDYGLRN